MAYYVRKIARAKWSVLNDGAEKIIENYRADAIANDMKTTNNTLSFWRVDSLSEVDLEPVIVINSLLGDTINKIELLCIPEEMLTEFSFEPQDGDTIVVNYKKLHFNLVKMTIKTLLDFAKDVVLTILHNDEKEPKEDSAIPLIRRIGKPEQLELIIKWLDRDEFSLDDLKEKQREAVIKQRAKNQK